MSNQLVFGHKNPDTDAIGAAIALATLMAALGEDATAVALGQPNAETKFALEKFGLKMPEVVDHVADLTDKVMLVDHNEFQQSVSDIKDVEITHVVDHHRISNFETANPLFYRAAPYGATSTIIWLLYLEKGIEIPTPVAGIMMSAIISDTLLLKSPTTTEIDKKALKELAKIAGVDYEKYGIEMLKAGTDTSDKSTKELLDGDAKSFEMNGKTVRVGQMNTVDIDDVLTRKDDFIKDINSEIAADKYDLFVFVITDILNSNSKAIVIGSESGISNFKKAFGKNVVNDVADLPGVVSRKKQIVPQLTAAY